ncbi:transposase domain-containing protein [Pedobacter sp. MC2016-05]|uniref:transposase domain-containing protein n=1 Tax=Pedobacter sp. MC2016-05 TaxID=2994474 RepID=UPI0022465EB9|nr:transposase domain-containing protein [Pedobacter sp. MC2016-05]MCX2473739.1 transposase domain-containing protein [Pedobacter sp. MC2016-05]
MYSILESCALNDIEPFAYVQDALQRLPNLLFATNEKIDELLPSNWKPTAVKIYSATGIRESTNVA